MRVAIALAATLCMLGCSRDDTPASVAQPSTAAESSSLHSVPPDWSTKRALGTGTGADPFGAAAAKPIRRATAQPIQPSSSLISPPPPFAYVGKVVRGRILYAVMARDDRVFLVRASDTLDAYRVLSVSENEVLLAGGDTGDTYTVPFSPKSGTSAALPLSAVPGVDDASLEVSAPSQVSVGEEFTLTISLDSGVNTVLETGRVEVRYDSRVLQIPGQSTSSGVARLDVAGAYAGHPMPGTLQFRVVAATPTTTEIRVVPTSIADTEGRDVAVNTPQPHKLTIVRAAAPRG
jgi:hypothetical protein